MDLSTLLAREGIEAGELDAILKWARHRAAALVARIEPGSPLAEALGPALERSRDGNAAPVPQPAQRSAPRPTARAVSKPHLGAAVQAALSGKHEDLDLALETAAAAEAVVAESGGLEPPVLEDSPPPAPAEPELDDNDPSIGGFNRFAFSFRRREAEKVAAEESRSSLTLTRDFETHAEETASSGEWNADAIALPEPPSFEAKRPTFRRGPEADLGDGEASGLLVLGIPDEEGIDVPVPRPRPSSARFDSRENSAPHIISSVPAALARAQAEAREPSRPQSSTRPLQPSLDDEDSFDLGLDNLETDPVTARPTSSPQPSAPTASQTSDPQASGPQASAQRMDSGPQRVDSGPQRVDSGPNAPRMQGSGPHGPPPPPPPRPVSSPAPAANKTQALRSLPPPPPREGKRNGRPPPAPAAAVKPAKVEPTPAPSKRGAKRKKVVELSQPVARPTSAPMAAATAPSERSGQRPIPADDEVLPRRAAVPDYLRDDDDE